uniref:tail fiber protein n=3 Tax=Pseudomonas faucium TaxID=2740518 RepID=UPI0035A238EB
MTNALAAKAPLASPTFTGVPKAPTAASTANDTSLATTQFVQSLLGAFGWGSGGVQGSNIPNGTNLNSIVTPGSYGQSSSFQATTELNYPEPSAGTLLVQAAGLSIVTQQYTLHTANNKVFVRTCYAGTWSKWDETAKVVSPVFSGVPQAPTAPVGTNTGQIATMAAILAGMLQYGIGGTSPAVSDLDAVSASGLYRCTSTAVNAPNTGCLLHIQYGSAGQASVQIHLNTTSSVPVLQIRSKTTTMAYGAWVPLASLADITAAFAAVGVGGVGAIAPAYTVTPAQCNNVSATRVIQALSTDDQATVGSPVAGQAFGGWHIIRAIRPAQLGVAGAGAGASLWWRGFTGPAPSQDDWIQGAPLNSPAFTGAPTAPTQAAGNNTTRLATTAFVQAAISTLVASAPGALDTLNELATALGNDPNFATTMTNSLAAKAPLASPGLTGVPTAPTAAVGTSNSQVATTAFVRASMAKYGLGTADLLDLVGVDLNTVFEGGQYFAGNGTNFPPGITNGYLTVWGNAFTHGAQKMIGAGNGVEWTRTAVAGVWTEWAMDGAPPGTIVYFPGFLPPPGYLKANGAQVSRTTYAKLFSAIGTVGGAGDGSTTFNVPDLRGEFVRSWDDARGVDQNRALMSVQISQNLSHAHGGVTDANGAHSHAVSGYTTSSGAHAHPVNRALNSSVGSLSDRVTTAQGDSGVAAAVTGGGDHSHSFSGNSDTVGLHAHNLSIWADGGNEARPRNIAMLACIKY